MPSLPFTLLVLVQAMKLTVSLFFQDGDAKSMIYLRHKLLRKQWSEKWHRSGVKKEPSHNNTKWHKSCCNMAKQSNWDSYLLVQLYEQYRFGDSDLEEELRRLQRVEFDQIFRFTYRQAVGE